MNQSEKKIKELRERPFLSVIIPVYNGSHYLRETVASVLQQPCKDFELLLLDDGSTDTSLAICNDILAKKEDVQPFIRVFSQSNIGVSKTRNKGIGLAQGTVVIFMDQDDAMRSDFYTEEIKEKLFKLNGQGVDMIMNGMWNADDKLYAGTFASIEREVNKGVYPGNCQKLVWNFLYPFHANIFFRSLFFHGETPSPVRFFELPLDVESTFRHIAKYASRKILVSDEFSFSIRRNNNESVSATWDWLKVYPVKANAYYDILEWHRKYYPKDKKAIKDAQIWLLKKIDELIEGYSCDPHKEAMIADVLRTSSYAPEIKSLIRVFPIRSIVLRAYLFGKNYKYYLKLKRLSVLYEGIKWRALQLVSFHKKTSVIIKGNLLKL